MTVSDSNCALKDEFENLLQQSFGMYEGIEGSVVKGRVLAIEGDIVLIDVGLKTEGRIALREFAVNGQTPEIGVDDVVDVYVERIENACGEAVLSREKAKREEAWLRVEEAFKAGQNVQGSICARVKGGFTVDLGGVMAFLPGSQVDVRPLRDIAHLMDMSHDFAILKMDHMRGNIVVSRRALLEVARAEQRAELVGNLEKGAVVKGVVKNITDYGAFINLGGIDGLLHVTDISWKRVNHPSEYLTIGQEVEVMIIKICPDNYRLSLGIKQLSGNPWEGVEDKFKVGSRHSGKITNIVEYGAFCELDAGVEGLIHISEFTWDKKKNMSPSKIVSIGQEVEVEILEVDITKRRISMGMKQCVPNPWKQFSEQYNVGDVIEGEIQNITEFGLFVNVHPDVDGMVHLTDLSWTNPGEEELKCYEKGKKVEVKVLEIDLNRERIALGIKQLQQDPIFDALPGARRGDVVTCQVTAVNDNNLEVLIAGKLKATIARVELARDRSEQRTERFAVDDKIDAKITYIGKGKVEVSPKALEIAEEKEAIAQYGSVDSGASLGDILGVALEKKRLQEEQNKKEESDNT